MFRCQRLLHFAMVKPASVWPRPSNCVNRFEYHELCRQAAKRPPRLLEHLRRNPAWRHLLRSLGALAGNLRSLDTLTGQRQQP